MDPIDLLEQRIAALELKILPKEETFEVDALQTVADKLLQINTLISSALSCREVVTAILTRMTELNEYLDPNFFENKLDTEAKKQFILAIYPDVKQSGESIYKLKKLVCILNSDSVRNALSWVPKLQQLTLESSKTQEECQKVSQNIVEALQQYKDIIFSISRTFIRLEEIVAQMETEINPVTAIDN